MTSKRKAFSQKLWEVRLLVLLLALILPLGLIAKNGRMLSSPVKSLFSQPQEPTLEASHERQVSVCEESVDDYAKPVRVTDPTVTPGLLIHKVQPKYPKAARKAHIEGAVVLCAVIGKDGKIANLHVASGPKELIASAVTAVQEWVYKPYILDGEPVVVQTEIRVNFSLHY